MNSEMDLIAQIPLLRPAEGLLPIVAFTIIRPRRHATFLQEIIVTLLALARLLEI